MSDIKYCYCPSCNIFVNFTTKKNCATCQNDLRYKCNFCAKMFAKPPLLVRHFYRQHGDHIYPCRSCNRKFSFQGDANAHMKICGSGPGYSCKVCYFKTRYRYNMKKHMQRIHNTIFICEHCNRKFESQETLDKHNKYCYYHQEEMIGSQ